jgi:hypothetical protein
MGLSPLLRLKPSLRSVNADGKLTGDQKRKLSLLRLLLNLLMNLLFLHLVLIEAGLDFSDLPAETPVDVRTDENGNASNYYR